MAPTLGGLLLQPRGAKRFPGIDCLIRLNSLPETHAKPHACFGNRSLRFRP